MDPSSKAAKNQASHVVRVELEVQRRRVRVFVTSILSRTLEILTSMDMDIGGNREITPLYEEHWIVGATPSSLASRVIPPADRRLRSEIWPIPSTERWNSTTTSLRYIAPSYATPRNKGARDIAWFADSRSKLTSPPGATTTPFAAS